MTDAPVSKGVNLIIRRVSLTGDPASIEGKG